jgi:hypothetical protein
MESIKLMFFRGVKLLKKKLKLQFYPFKKTLTECPISFEMERITFQGMDYA